MKLFRLDRTDPLSFWTEISEILVEWIAPKITLLLWRQRKGGWGYKNFFRHSYDNLHKVVTCFSNMASKMDEDSEEKLKSVATHLPSDEGKNDGLGVKQIKEDRDRIEASKASKNPEIVNEVVDNFSGDESESETFQDAVQDLHLNEKMDSLGTTEEEAENNDKLKDSEGVAEEEEILTPEEKEVCTHIIIFLI